MKILIINSHTLYLKSTLPVAIECLRKGWEVTFCREKFRLSKYIKKKNFVKYIVENPTSVEIINIDSLLYVSKIIGIEDDLKKYIKKIKFSYSAILRQSRYDKVIATIKNRDLVTNKKNSVLVGYEHLPIIACFKKTSCSNKSDINKSSIFFNSNEFSEDHNFKKIFSNINVVLNSYTYLDKVSQCINDKKYSKDNRVLIFHPGGYRDVISSYGDDKITCYKSQEKFISEVCLPLIRNGFKPIIKIHPLRAKFHDYEDVVEISQRILHKHEIEFDMIHVIKADEWFWEDAFQSSFIMSFGSSAIYDLWSVGLKNVYVCNFFGRSRSDRFSYFESIFIDSSDDFEKLILSYKDKKNPKFDKFTLKIFQAYNKIFDGKSTERVMISLAN